MVYYVAAVHLFCLSGKTNRSLTSALCLTCNTSLLLSAVNESLIRCRSVASSTFIPVRLIFVAAFQQLCSRIILFLFPHRQSRKWMCCTFSCRICSMKSCIFRRRSASVWSSSQCQKSYKEQFLQFIYWKQISHDFFCIHMHVWPWKYALNTWACYQTCLGTVYFIGIHFPIEVTNWTHLWKKQWSELELSCTGCQKVPGSLS